MPTHGITQAAEVASCSSTQLTPLGATPPTALQHFQFILVEAADEDIKSELYHPSALVSQCNICAFYLEGIITIISL